jgi:hypothetical protein
MKYKTFYRVRGLDNLQLKVDELYRSYYMANTCMLSYLERECVAWVEEETRVYESGYGWKTTEANI